MEIPRSIITRGAPVHARRCHYYKAPCVNGKAFLEAVPGALAAWIPAGCAKQANRAPHLEIYWSARSAGFIHCDTDLRLFQPVDMVRERPQATPARWLVRVLK